MCIWVPEEHITHTKRWSRIVEESRMVRSGLTCLTFSACTQRDTFTQVGQIVEDSPG
jgi:hypothetical protein